jgi:hypothetical protein
MFALTRLAIEGLPAFLPWCTANQADGIFLFLGDRLGSSRDEMLTDSLSRLPDP